MVNNIKRILQYFVCEQFINEKFRTLRVSEDVILLHLKCEPKKGFKKICRIDICRDIISLNIGNFVNNLKEDITICIEGKQITFKVSQTENHQRNRSKTNVSISVTKNEQNKSYTKDADDEIECINKGRYIILCTVFLKYVRKKR